MTESNKRVIQFGAIFAFGAILIFIFLINTKPAVNSVHDADLKSHDSLIVALETEAVDLKTALANNPDSIDLIILLANHYYDLNKYNDAIEYYERALALRPANPEALADCAVMYYKSGESDKALEYLDKAINLQPDLAQAYFNKGLILMAAKNDPDGAVAIWRKYLEIAPESDEARFLAEQIKAIESGQ